eukprot:GHRR01014300.1.p1 GENE.GHRR01014300.1~~GHRR01014300.1.p1  ORF type:complete len:277 (+),score=140.82 GHRR01014300.1:249-1079(+)
MGCQVEMKALDELIGQKLPRLAAHLTALEADVSILATDWYLTLFATSMPAETVARVWDGLFNEGPKVLFRTALALLQAQEEQLLRFDSAGELLMAVRQHATTMHDRDRLMHTAFEGVGSLPMATIERYRDQRAAEVEAAVRDRRVMCNRQGLKNTLETSQKQHNNSSMEAVDEQLEGMNINEQLNELGKQAGVLSKQAASNIKKGFGSFMAGAKELSAKAQAEINKRTSKTGSSGGAAGEEHQHAATAEGHGRVAGKQVQHPPPYAQAMAEEDELM